MTVLPAPGGLLDGIDLRVQEDIHGHRLVQEQEPFMIVLETLAVCAAVPLGSHPVTEGVHENIDYELPHRKTMRFLLFQDRHLEQVARDEEIADHEKWDIWKARVNDQFNPNRNGHDAFEYLDRNFNRDFEALRQAIRLLLSREIDVMHNRRWTSRFLAVTGPDMICTDMRDKSGNWSADRRFFGRGGELVYLMLNRSTHAQEIGDLVARRLLNEEDPMNKVAVALSAPGDKKTSSTQIGYLPYQHLPAYDRLAEDWRNILQCERLPNSHLFEPLFRVTGLNLITYLAERAQDETDAPARIPTIMDLTDGRNQHLRQDARKQLDRQRKAANRAVRSHVQRKLDNNERWLMAVDREDGALGRNEIKNTFAYKNFTALPASPLQQVDALVEHATSRDKNNVHRYLLPLARGSGALTTRPRIGPWFALDDNLLFALVLANAEGTIELREFVARLYKRYGIVIGPEEARKAFDRIHAERFEENLAAFENRLTGLSLTQRLSDDCAFVTNPYR